MLTSSSEISQTTLKIRQDDKFYGRLLAKENLNPLGNTSCRVYYGVAAGAVPFMWESQPGTPKHPSSSTKLPPLTPPPSYLSNPKKGATTKKQYSKSNLLMTILPKLALRKSTSSSSLSLSSSSSSSSSSTPDYRRSRYSSPRSSFSSKGEEEDPALIGSPTSILHCFGFGRDAAKRICGCNHW